VLTRIWSFLTGYVSLVVEGKSLEKLINMAVSRGLYLWDVKWLDQDRARVNVRLNAIKSLRHMARRKSRFRIVNKAGLPFRIARVKKRKILWVGAVLSVFLVYLMSSFIWFVEVEGNKSLPAEKVISAAEHAGLGMGTLKLGLDKDKIERYIKNAVPEVAWVGVRITGTKALIEIAEKVLIPPVDNSPADVAAERDGLVQQLLVLNGKAVVNEGDMVKQGDVLITGVIKPELKPEEEQSPETPGQRVTPEPIKFVRAKGIVRAKVWYDGYGECRLVDAGTKRTGGKTEVLSIRIAGKQIILKGPKSPPYHEYSIDEHIKKLPEWRNLHLPVEIVTTNYYEVKKYRDIIGVSQARSIAEKNAQAIALAKISDDAKVIKEIIEEIPDRGSNLVRVKVIIEVVEDIGCVEPMKPDDMLRISQEGP